MCNSQCAKLSFKQNMSLFFINLGGCHADDSFYILLTLSQGITSSSLKVCVESVSVALVNQLMFSPLCSHVLLCYIT